MSDPEDRETCPRAALRSEHGPKRLAAMLLARKEHLIRSSRRRGSSSSSRNTLSLSESETLVGSKKGHEEVSRNSSSGQSAATFETALSSPQKDGRQSSKRRYEEVGDDFGLDGLEMFAEKEMNSLQRHIPALQRHDIKTSTIRQHYYPEGGWGWVVCGCVFAIQVITSGLQFSFGVLYTDLVELVGKEKALDACWVGALCMAVSRAISPLIVALCRRKSTRVTAVIGGLVMALAVLFTSFAHQLHQVFLSWGLLLGVGIGMTRETSNLMIGQYFKRRREFVEIISESGSGVGITLFSVFFKETIRSVGWRLGLQAVTGAVFSSFFLGVFYRSASLYHPQRRAILHLKNQKKKQVKDKKKVGEKPPYFDFSSLRLRSVHVLLAASALASAGVYAPLFFIIYGGQEEGMEDSALILLQTFLGFASALGCIFFGIVVVRRSSQCLISRQYLCQGSLFSLGITIISLTAIHGYYGYVLFMWLYGIQLGAAHYSVKMLTLEKVRARQFPRAWGFIQGATALPILFGIPITGYINAVSPKTGYFFSSALTVLGASSLFLLNAFKKLEVADPTPIEDRLTPPDPPAFPVPNGASHLEASDANLLPSIPFREPVCTCGVDPRLAVPNIRTCASFPPNRDLRLHSKRWNKTPSFAAGPSVSDDAIFDRYYDYMMDCPTTCNHYFPYSDFNRECMESSSDRGRCDRSYQQCQNKGGHNLLGRKLRQTSGVSFSEPEDLSRLGHYSCGCPPSCERIVSSYFQSIPPPPRAPCLKGSLHRPRKGVTLIEDVTTSV